MGASIGDTGHEGENFENNVFENTGRIDYGLALDRSSVLGNGCSFYYITGGQAIHCNGREGKMQLHFSRCIFLLISLVLHTVSLLREVRGNALFILWQKFLLFYFYFLIQCLTHSRYVINV